MKELHRARSCCCLALAECRQRPIFARLRYVMFWYVDWQADKH